MPPPSNVVEELREELRERNQIIAELQRERAEQAEKWRDGVENSLRKFNEKLDKVSVSVSNLTDHKLADRVAALERFRWFLGGSFAVVMLVWEYVRGSVLKHG